MVDEMDFESLLNLAQTSRIFSSMCLRSYKHRYSDLEIVIENGYTYHTKAPAKEPSLRFSKQTIKIIDFKMSLKALRHFGSEIQFLRLNLANAHSDESMAIIQYVETYCADSLTKLVIDVQKGNVLQYIYTKSFEKVEHIQFEGNLPSADEQLIPINHLFPALRAISLRVWSADNDFLSAHFPHLERLHITIPLKNQNSEYAFGLLEKNPQIRSVSVYPYVPELLEKLSSMPQLENLTLKSEPVIIKESRFQHVIKFTAEDDMILNAEQLLFPNLEEFEFSPRSSEYGNWHTFLENHQTLKRFNLHFGRIKDAEFKKITTGLPNLEEMHLYSRFQKTIGIDTIVEFIEKHQQLKKIFLEACSETSGQQYCICIYVFRVLQHYTHAICSHQ